MKKKKFKKKVKKLRRSLLHFRTEFADTAVDDWDAVSDLRRMGIYRLLQDCSRILDDQ